MNILVPCDPVNSREVKPDFADQAAAAERAGFAAHLLSFEDLVYESTPSHAVRRVPEDAGPYLYRGWMLKPPAYAALAAALDTRGAPLVVGPSAYVYAHQLPGWYSDFQLFAAPTVWTASGDLEEARAALRRLQPGPAIVKDYEKSAKHRWHEAYFIPDTRDEVAALQYGIEKSARPEPQSWAASLLPRFNARARASAAWISCRGSRARDWLRVSCQQQPRVL